MFFVLRSSVNFSSHCFRVGSWELFASINIYNTNQLGLSKKQICYAYNNTSMGILLVEGVLPAQLAHSTKAVCGGDRQIATAHFYFGANSHALLYT